MTLISKSQAARAAGVSPMAITKAIATKELTTLGEGRVAKIDIDNPKNAERIALFQERKKAEPERGKKRTDAPLIAPKKKSYKSNKRHEIKKPPANVPGEINEEDSTTEDRDANRHDRSHLDKLKIIEQTRKLKLERQIKRGEYVKRDMVSKIMGGLYDIDLNVLVASSPGLAKNIASYAGIDESDKIIGIEKIIHDQMFEVLVHKKGHLNKFLLSIKGEVIE